jgi:hypothetical protein
LHLTIQNIDASTSVSGMTLSANTTIQGTTYQWVDCDANNAPIPGAVNQFFTATDNGNYAVIITQGNCEVMSACVTVSDVGINEHSSADFSVYPNPSSDEITIQGDVFEGKSFSIYDQQGRMVLFGRLAGFKTKISVESFAEGTYLVKIADVLQPIILLKN